MTSEMSNQNRFRRVLIKLSGEALMGGEDYGIDPAVLHRIAAEIRDLIEHGVQVAVVIGGGNIFRGAGLAAKGMDRVSADQMGMLATVINAIAIQDALEREGLAVRAPGLSPLFTAPELIDLVHALRAIDNPLPRLVLLTGGKVANLG